MSRLYSTAPTSLLRRRSSPTSTSRPSRQAPHAALSAATERARSGTLSPEDAHDMFDDLLLQATPVPERALTSFLAAVARAQACSDGLSLVVALFNRMPRCDGTPVAPPTVHTYGILLDSCCRARQPDLALAFFGRFLRVGLKANNIIVNTLLKVLCHAKRTDEAVDVLLHRMPHLGCVPDAISYTTVIKGLCDDSRSQHALDLLRMMAKQEAACSPDVVSYNTVIHGLLKEGKFSTTSNLFNEMVQQGVVPDAVTYSSIIGALCKRGRSREARQILDCGILKGLKPDIVAYTTMLHGYATEGRLVDMNNLYNLMIGEVDTIRPSDVHLYSHLDPMETSGTKGAMRRPAAECSGATRCAPVNTMPSPRRMTVDSTDFESPGPRSLLHRRKADIVGGGSPLLLHCPPNHRTIGEDSSSGVLVAARNAIAAVVPGGRRQIAGEEDPRRGRGPEMVDSGSWDRSSPSVAATARDRQRRRRPPGVAGCHVQQGADGGP
ncbi:hypothetical protein QYE76_016764 [Lolium multiflorum]|uniref:Pentatricopeptide repeat-containing protein n=1 Tax=Lolium multiflorum TaxID=4521 RepID=A0AAD8VDK8_LOLMU|nr:hypothetical protein QYE76_016764 [Lolium multiflorum]